VTRPATPEQHHHTEPADHCNAAGFGYVAESKHFVLCANRIFTSKLSSALEGLITGSGPSILKDSMLKKEIFQ